MNISVNTKKLKDTKDEEPVVTDIEIFKAPGHFKLFECSKESFNNLDSTYKRACMASVKVKY